MTIRTMKAKLSELAHLLKWGISDGWGSTAAGQ